MSDITSVLFVLLVRQRQGKALGADPSPLIHYQVESFLNALFLPIAASFRIKNGKVLNEGVRAPASLIMTRLNVMLTELGIVLLKTYIIDKHYVVNASALCAFALFQCGHPQH